jgi:hypothetical protein
MSLQPGSLFPILIRNLTYDDIEDDYYDSLKDVGRELEFYDEFMPWRIQAVAGDGSPLRLICYALDVVLCQRTRAHPTSADLEIRPCTAINGLRGFAELCLGEVHRTLWTNGSIAPLDPLGSVEIDALLAGTSPTPAEFNRSWLDARPR